MKITDRYGTVLRCYDNGGRSFDRYTILPPRWAVDHLSGRLVGGGTLWAAIGSSQHPFHPQGFGQHISAVAGPHLGRRVRWSDLPADVQKFAREYFPEFAPEG